MKDLNKICDVLGEEIISYYLVGGGCIANAQLLIAKSGNKYFLKDGYFNQMFLCEANGLKEISSSNTIRTPKVYYADESCLLLEYIESGIKKDEFYKRFGELFAQMHQCTSDKFGFYEDNYIGATNQINTYSDNWCDFYFNNRLLHQFKLAEKNGYVSAELKGKFNKLENKIEHILSGSEDIPCLLHGDLWGGNYMVSNQGEPVLIDPAVYYGNREADLAMTKLFGGFTQVFYDSYQKKYPLPEGYHYRENIYLLYHVLNHLNLFGSSYYHQSISLMDYYL